MSKAKKEKKPKKGEVSTETETFFVGQKNGTTEYVSGYNKQTQTPEFSTDINEAIWSYDSAKVQLYLTRNNITNVTVQQKKRSTPQPTATALDGFFMR